MTKISTSRRGFLRSSGALVVTFSLARHIARASAAGATPGKTVAPDEVDGFLAIHGNGMVTAYSGKVDLGTGVRTALTQIVAEELDVPLSRVRVIEGDTALTPDQGPSSGSFSIQNGGMQLRRAAATARQALLQYAANRLHTSPGNLAIADGTVREKSSGKSISYAELIGGRAFSLKLDKDAPLKDPAKYKVVGTSVPRLDIPDKVTGRFTYLQDFRRPGMLHGRVVRPPAIGATLQSVDESSIKGIPGVRVVGRGNFLAVVAEHEWAAIKAMRQLKATWSSWAELPQQDELWDHVRRTRVAKDDVTSNVGDAATAIGQAPKRLKASYDFAIHTHGSIGPSCAVAEIKDGRLTCWTPSQATHNLRKQLAAMLGMPDGDVRCTYIEGSGCYGRNGHEDAAGDAALLAQAVGAPVRVQWMREDEHGWDPKGAPTLVDLEAALDGTGGVLAWSSQFFIPEGAAGNVELIAATLAGLPHDPGLEPGNILNNSAIPYNFPNIRTLAHRLAETPLRPAWIRSPGRLQNTFANECFIDELAHAVGADPLDFRLRHLDDSRGIALLQRLARLTNWENRPWPQRQSGDVVKGRGLSYVKYELVRTYVGAVAEVAVNRKTGDIRVTRVTVVQDCGQIINPDGVRNQIEGNVVQTLSRTLKEEVTFDRSHVTSVDWASYPILTFPDLPEVAIDLIDRPLETPWGAGEPSSAVVPSAVSNAVFDAVGARLRSVPFTPTKVRSAIQAA